jgi:Stress responsive A/B Barrel Domain
MTIRTKLFCLAAGLAIFGSGLAVGARMANKPKSVLHIITMKWTDGATAEQKKQAIDGIEKMASRMPGITNLWLKTLKVQPEEYNNVFVMEFKDEAAFKAYADDPAHREWEKIYVPLRGQSTTHDVTN